MKLFITITLLALSSTLLAATKKPAPQVFTEKAKFTKIAKTLLFPAIVKSRVESNIKADEDVIVIKHLITLGSRVKKGDKLLELRNQDTSSHYQNKILRAPVSGIVAAILVEQGQYLQKGQDLIKLNEPKDLYLKLEVPAAHFADMNLNLQGHGTTRVISGNQFRAKVTGIGSVIDPMTATLPVEMSFISGQEGLVPGAIANVEITLQEKEIMQVPEAALYYSGEKIFLPVLRNGKVQKIEVKIGQRLKGQVEIMEGIKLGEELIIGAGEFLKDGDKVEVAKKL